MDIKTFDPDTYLGRINHPGSVRPTADGLEALHRAQIGTIPFENFDILLGRGISLEPAAVFDKLVCKSRGGYCFELNGLFLAALRAFGFDARPVLARVHRSGSSLGRGHQISLVNAQGRHWIADVGFGAPYSPAPLPLEIDRSATFGKTAFRFVEAGAFGIMFQTLTEGLWQDLYSFDLGQVCRGDILYGNHFTSTHPDSFFTYARVAAILSPDGPVSLFNLTLKKSVLGTEQACELVEGQAYLDALKTHFGIVLDAPYEALPPILEKAPETRAVIGF